PARAISSRGTRITKLLPLLRIVVITERVYRMYRTIAHRNARACSRESARGADSKRVCGHSSVDDAIVQVREAIQVHIERLLTDGEPIPEERERPQVVTVRVAG